MRITATNKIKSNKNIKINATTGMLALAAYRFHFICYIKF